MIRKFKVVTGFTKIMAKIGALIGRQQAWSTRDSEKQLIINLSLFGSLVAIGLFGFWVPVNNYLDESKKNAPEIRISGNDWHLNFSKRQNCTVIACEKTQIYPQKKALLISLSDEAALVEIRKPENHSFWAIAEINKAAISKARIAKADVLVVGYLNAAFKIFIDGDLRLSGDGKDYLPVTLHLSSKDFSKDTIVVSIEINQSLGSSRPLVVDAPFSHGLFNAEQYRALINAYIFGLVIRPLGLAIFSLLAAIIFFFLWVNVRDRNEYFLFSIYMLCMSSSQLLSWGYIKHSMDRGSWYQLDLAIRLFEGFSAALAGISYARLRLGAYAWMIFFTTIISIILTRSGTNPGTYLFLSRAVGIYYVPLCFLIGSMACQSQANLGQTTGFQGLAGPILKKRIARLLLFSQLNLFLGLVYLWGAQTIFATNSTAIFHRPVQYLAIALIGYYLLKDFREFDIKQQKIVASKFHDPTLKEQHISYGFLLAMDLKGSSKLYDASAKLGLNKKIPTTWCEAATEIIEQTGGTKISSAGDSVIAFFEGRNEISKFSNAVESLLNIERISGLFAEQGLRLTFRACIINAAIKPIYKSIGRKIYEDFEDAPGETCFKDLMRLIEAEKKFNFFGTSILVLEEGTRHLSDTLSLVSEKKEELYVRDVGTKELNFINLTDQTSKKKSLAFAA